VINYLDRQTLAVLAPVLLQRYNISAESYSRIISAFMLAYTVSNGFSGRLLDKLGTRLGYALTIAFWSAAELLHAFARGAISFGVFRFLLGLGEAGNYPAGVKLIAEWFPAEERSLASGIFNSGASIGAILAPPLLAWIALSLGTGVAFSLVGALGFLWLAVWLLIYKEAPRRAQVADQVMPARLLLRSKFLWQFTLSKVFSDPVWYFYTFWIPQYLRTVQHFSLKQIGATAWIPFFTAAVGNMLGGAAFAALRRLPFPLQTVRRLCILLFSALMTSALLIPGRTSPAVCLGLMSVATFGYSGALANLLALPADAFPQEAVGSVWGFASMGSGFGGMLFSLVTGWLVQHYSFTPAFVLFGTLPLVSALLVWTLPAHGTSVQAGELA
jgi:ACS family hexuronate transporter-like MFS transporter